MSDDFDLLETNAQEKAEKKSKPGKKALVSSKKTKHDHHPG